MKQRMEKEELDTESYCQMKKDILCVWREMMAHAFSVFWLALREKVLKQYISTESLKFALHPSGQYRGILLQLSGILMPAVKSDCSPQVDTGLPGGTSGKEAACQSRRHKRCRFISLSREVSWRRSWQPTPVFLPGEAHGQRSPMGYSPQGSKESDGTEVTQHAQRIREYVLPGFFTAKL